jgi:hypothetical protein
MDQVEKAGGRKKSGNLRKGPAGHAERRQPAKGRVQFHRPAAQNRARMQTCPQRRAPKGPLQNSLNHIGSQSRPKPPQGQANQGLSSSPVQKRVFFNAIKGLQWITKLFGEKLWINRGAALRRSAHYAGPEQALMHTMWKADSLAQYAGAIGNMGRTENITQ